MPKTLSGKKVSEDDWKKAKELAKKEGFSIKKDKVNFYKYTMGILKQMMSKELEETTVAGDIAVPNVAMKLKTNDKPAKWSDLIRRGQ